MLNNDYEIKSKQIEVFGRKLKYIIKIFQSGDKGIFLKEMERQLKEHYTQVKRDIDELEEADIVKTIKKPIEGKQGIGKYVILTDNGKILYDSFIEYSKSIPKELEKEFIEKIDELIDRFYELKSDKGKQSAINSIREEINKKIALNKYYWDNVPKLKNFLNDFIININNYPHDTKDQFFITLRSLYTSGYLDTENLSNFLKFLKENDLEKATHELYFIIPIYFQALSKKPNNDIIYDFLMSTLKITRNTGNIVNSLNSCSGIINQLPYNIKNKLINDLDEMLSESKENEQLIIEKVMDFLII